jgi:hypothetical protein
VAILGVAAIGAACAARASPTTTPDHEEAAGTAATALASVRRDLERVEEEQFLPEEWTGREAAFLAERKAAFRAFESFAQQHWDDLGIEADSPASDWDFATWAGLDAWLEEFRALNDDARCDAVEAAYMHAVIQLAVVDPVMPVTWENLFFSDDDLADPAIAARVRRERQLAAWPLRYVEFTPMAEIPAACREVAKKARSRWRFIFTERRPLGIMIGLCGRPSNTHYIDHEADLHAGDDDP